MIEATIIGRISKDPELRSLGDKYVLCFNLATDDYNSKTKGYDTTWLRINFWGKQAEIYGEKFVKGDEIIVFGSLKECSYIKDNQTFKYLEVNSSKMRLAISRKDKAGSENTGNTDIDNMAF